MKDIYVVTHTQSHHHVEGLVGGWHDSSLTDHGRAQARLVAARLQATLKDVAPIEVYASDLLRAEETAAIIAAALGVAAQTTADLRERSLGEAGGKPQAWLAGRVIPRRRRETASITETACPARNPNESFSPGSIAPWTG
jgi:probable phosphoglycerate mutase